MLTAIRNLLELVMQNTQNLISEDEIDMRELFAILWAYKIFIACTCALGIVLGGSYALNLKKEFTSEAVFRLDQGETGGISLGGKLGALASFAGLGSDAGSSLPTDQIMGRIFIEKLDSQLHFATDPFFNKYNPNFVEPFWKLTLKRFIGWKKHSSDVEESIWQGIVSVFSKSG